MLVNSVVIVLREVLEAMLLISVMLALSRRMQIGLTWLSGALLLGAVGAIAYAQFLGPISELFEGVGQELVNSLMQFGVFAGLALVVFLIAWHYARDEAEHIALPLAMAATVALALTREGSEIIVFVSGFLQMESLVMSVTLGSIAGAAIGCSVGVFLYYLLLAIPERRAAVISLVLLCLAASSMCSQATRLLIQADWISVAGPVWDSSDIISEQSLIGQLLYAVIGYEASPSAMEVFAYSGSIVIIVACAIFGWLLYARQQETIR